MAHRGNFFVIEGTDGSGKGTQFKLLSDRLQKAGYDVATFDFPRYEEDSSYFVRQYLNGKYGTADEVGPYTGSLFFSLDRYEAAPAIRAALDAGKIVLANRFTGSNMAHQGTKFVNAEQRRGYFIWLDNLEFQMLSIPRPDMNIVLRVPAEIAQSLVDKKEKRNYTDKKRDIHEADLGHLQRSVEVYDDLCNLFPKDFNRIDCVRSGKLLSIDDVQKLLWEKLQPLLPAPSTQRNSVTTDTAQRSEAAATETPKTETRHSLINASALTASRLSQLGVVVVQTPLLSKYNAVRNNDGQFNYYVPPQLDPTSKNLYCETLDRIYELHAALTDSLTKYLTSVSADKDASVHAQQITQAVLPAAAQTDLIWQATNSAAEIAIATLLQSKSSEENAIGQLLLSQLADNTPDILAHAITEVQPKTDNDKPAKLQKLANKLLSHDYSAETGESLTLTAVTPRNELDLVTDILYQYSDKTVQNIRRQVNELSYDSKLEIFETYLNGCNESSRLTQTLLQKINYSFDVLSDLDTLYAFQALLPTASTLQQELSPRLGYEVPEIIEEAELIDQYQSCFDLSLSLHSKLQQASYTADAHYAVLLGHRVRWQTSFDAADAMTLRGIAKNLRLSPSFHSLVKHIENKLAEKHPLLSSNGAEY